MINFSIPGERFLIHFASLSVIKCSAQVNFSAADKQVCPRIEVIKISNILRMSVFYLIF